MGVLNKFSKVYASKQQDEMSLEDYLKLCKKDTLAYATAPERMLDAIGDLYLLGHNLIGEYYGFKSGHELNNQLLRKIESENAFKIIEIDEIKDAPINYLKPISEEVA